MYFGHSLKFVPAYAHFFEMAASGVNSRIANGCIGFKHLQQLLDTLPGTNLAPLHLRLTLTCLPSILSQNYACDCAIHDHLLAEWQKYRCKFQDLRARRRPDTVLTSGSNCCLHPVIGDCLL